jgi:hypothetical protein
VDRCGRTTPTKFLGPAERTNGTTNQGFDTPMSMDMQEFEKVGVAVEFAVSRLPDYQ